jgi:hypothetical protein
MPGLCGEIGGRIELLDEWMRRGGFFMFCEREGRRAVGHVDGEKPIR